MLYLVGLGINYDLSCSSLKALKSVENVYLESYTMPWHYKEVKKFLEDKYNIKIKMLDRKQVESNFLIKKSSSHDVALLIGGDVFSATTHFSIFQEAMKKGIKVKIFHNSSIFSAISKIGLSLYRFGETVTLSFWRKNYHPTSPILKIKKNFDAGLHSLVLLDVDDVLGFMHAGEGINLLKKMEEKENLSFVEEVVSVSRLGFNDEKIVFSSIENIIKKEIDLGKPPFSLVVPSKLSEYEKEFLSLYKI